MRACARVAAAAAFGCLLAASAAAVQDTAARSPATDAPDGDEIARRINAREDGTSLRQTIEMRLINPRGSERVRRTRSFRKYYGEEKRTMIVFDDPRNLKGTGFMTFDYPERDRDDDQWLYLPALRKVRRISASDRGDYFLGTDFTYEDIKKAGKLDFKDYRFERIGEEEVDGHPCFVVEAVARSEEVAKELGYSRLHLWADREIWMIRKLRAWDVKGNDLKTVDTKDIRLVDGIWTALRFEVQNHKTGHRTIFLLTDSDYEAEVDDDLFSERVLRRGP